MTQSPEDPHPDHLPEYREREQTSAALGVASGPAVVDTAEARDALSCPLCGYSLRGLSDAHEPRCPECGYRFAWGELLSARHNLHPYLFEHHKPGNVPSFFLTLWHGLRPAAFWSGLNAAHEVRVGRLLVYAAAVTVLVGGSLWAGWYLAHAGALYGYEVATRPSWGWARRTPRLGPAFLRRVLGYEGPGSIEAHFLLATFTWPWLTLAALLVFKMSMRRARIDVRHVLRCVIYTLDAFLWIVAAGFVVGLVLALGHVPARFQFAHAAETYLVFGLLGLVALATYRLGQAYQRYLRFEHPWGTVILSQVLVVLAVFTFLAAFDPAIWELFW